jgi:hypothetical protein
VAVRANRRHPSVSNSAPWTIIAAKRRAGLLYCGVLVPTRPMHGSMKVLWAALTTF